MSDTKHTAEPWIVCEKLSGSENHQGFTIRSRGGWAIAVVNPLDQHGTGGKANADRIVACVNACRGMADPEAEIAALRADVERLRQWIGSEDCRSDARSAADLRAKMEHYRSEVDRLKEIERRWDRMTNEEVKHKIGFESELAAYRRNESEAIAAIKAVGYVTPHGESDSLGEAMSWLVKENAELRKAEDESDAARHAMAQRLTEIANAVYGDPPPAVAWDWAHLAKKVKEIKATFTDAMEVGREFRMKADEMACKLAGLEMTFSLQAERLGKAAAAGDRLASSAELAAMVLSDAPSMAEYVRAALEVYRKERAS